MKVVGSREFQITYAKAEEPLRVEAKGKWIGTWYPAASAADLTVSTPKSGDVEALETEIRHLKTLLASKTPVAAKGVVVPLSKEEEDAWMKELSPQDRAFFERKLGTKRK